MKLSEHGDKNFVKHRFKINFEERREKVVLRNNKSTTISIRFTEEEKDMLNHVSFIKCIPISDVIREGLKLYFNDSTVFETSSEKRSRVWKI